MWGMGRGRALDGFPTGSGQTETGSSQKRDDSPEGTFAGRCGQTVADAAKLWRTIATCGNTCALKTSYDKCMELLSLCEKSVCPDPVWKPVT